MDKASDAAVSIVSLIGAIAILSILVSNRAQTAAVMQAFFSGVGNTIGVAMSPVTGASVKLNTAFSGG